MKQLVILLVCTLMYGSCTIKGSFRGLYSYYQQTKEESPGLLKPPGRDICTLSQTETPQVYLANGSQVLQCIRSLDKAIIYIWAPRCKSKNCYPLNLVQEKCNGVNAGLFIIAEYFDSELMNVSYKTSRPVFGIDIDHYKTDITSRYLSMFLQDLGAPGKLKGRFLSFKNGVYKGSFNTLEEMETD